MLDLCCLLLISFRGVYNEDLILFFSPSFFIFLTGSALREERRDLGVVTKMGHSLTANRNQSHMGYDFMV